MIANAEILLFCVLYGEIPAYYRQVYVKHCIVGAFSAKEFHMEERKKRFTVLPFLAASFLSLALAASCGNKEDGDPTSPGNDNPTVIQFNSATADGSTPTAKLTLSFSAAVAGLSAADITLGGTTGAAKGVLTATGTAGVYELAISGISSSGSVTVTVGKSGYSFNPSSQSVTVAFLNNKHTVFFNTSSNQTITPITNLDSGSKISEPEDTSSLSKDGFTFDGKWYKDYSFDSATGLRTYDSVNEWDFNSDTVISNMTLYAGWTGGVKIMPLTYIWENQPGHLQGEVIQLTAGKTYKLGIRYVLQPAYGPIQLQARRESGKSVYSITLEPGSDAFLQMVEEEFTAAESGGYFIGLSQVTTVGGGTYIVHEIWLKEAGGGDINLLTIGDFVWKDASSTQFNKSTNEANIGDPFWGPGGIRSEWPFNKWNMNNKDVHFTTSWDNFLSKLNELTGEKIVNNAHSNLVFPKPAHP
jgi:hypothetical protein